jgi:hypothetical protein
MIWNCRVQVEFGSHLTERAFTERAFTARGRPVCLGQRINSPHDQPPRKPRYVCRCADPAGRASAGAQRSFISALRTAQRQEHRRCQGPWIQDAAVRRGSRLPGTARRGRASGCCREACRQPIKKKPTTQRPPDEASEAVSGARAPERPTGTATAGDCPAGRHKKTSHRPTEQQNNRTREQPNARRNHKTRSHADRIVNSRKDPKTTR